MHNNGNNPADVGVIHGRFQILHHDHLKYLLAGKARSRHLIVGITNPDPSMIKDDPADPERSHAAANPLTYYERFVMVENALREAGIPDREFSIVPFPINTPELIKHYVPLDAVFYLTILDDWGRKKLAMFKSLGLKTEVLWEKPPEEKGLHSTDIRRLMIAGEPWEHLAPKSTIILAREWNIPQRLRKLLNRI